jgi:O-antigen ligase
MTLAAAAAGPSRRPFVAAFAERWAEPWLACLLFVYFLFGLIGSNPLSGGAPVAGAEGNVLRQAVLIGLFAGSLPVLVLYRDRLRIVVRENLLLILLYGWIAATALWSAHPPLTLRRVIAEILVLSLLAAAVCVARSWRTLVYPLAAAAAAIILANSLAIVLAPGLAFGPLGAMGIHTNKNLAGVITLVALILTGGSVFATPHRGMRLALLPLIALGFVFLLLTRSKTSVALAVLAASCFPVFYLTIRRWTVAPVMLPVALLSALALGVLVAAVLGIPTSAITEAMFGDATLTQRTELWAYLQANLAAHPWLGAGWGAFWDTGAPVNPINAPPQSWVLPATEINTAHNGYIDIWLQAGLVGLTLTVAMILRACYVLTRLIRSPFVGREDSRLIGALFCTMLILALYNGVESIILRPADTLSNLFLLGVIASERWYRLTETAGQSHR